MFCCPIFAMRFSYLRCFLLTWRSQPRRGLPPPLRRDEEKYVNHVFDSSWNFSNFAWNYKE